MFYSASTGGFYSHEFHGENIPNDAVEIADEHYVDLIAGQSDGKRIVVDGEGLPVLADSAPASPETLAANERAWRDAELAATDGIVARHRDEIEARANTTLTAKQYTVLQAYRNTLREWPETKDFPKMASRPVAPVWLNS